MNLKLLGPTGVQQRKEAIRQRREELGLVRNPDGSQEFRGVLRGVLPIGRSNESHKPFNPFGDNASIEGETSKAAFRPMIEEAAAEAGIDPRLFDALVAAESSYDPLARSRAGALGLSQLMPDTARSLGVSDPFDARQNLRGGATYLAQMLKRFDGDPRLALAAYNAGPGAVQKFGGIPPYDETKRYVERVLGLYESRVNP